MTLTPQTIELLRRRTICGARTKHGAVCERLSTPGNKRCYYHGGASTGCRTAEGKAAAVTAMVEGRKRWIARMREEVKAGLRGKVPGGRKSGETNAERTKAKEFKHAVKAAKPISQHMKHARLIRDDPDSSYAQDLKRTTERTKQARADKHDAKVSKLVYQAACEGVAGDLFAYVRNAQRARRAAAPKAGSEPPAPLARSLLPPVQATVSQPVGAVGYTPQPPEHLYGPYARYPGRDAPDEQRPYRSAHSAYPHPGNLRDAGERDRWMPHMQTKR